MGVRQDLRAGEGRGEVPTAALRDRSPALSTMPLEGGAKCRTHKVLSRDGWSE